jgi:DNA-binding NarL/FixJ family response regulator
MTNKEIARQLGISDKTIKTHLDHIFDKLKINRRMQLLLDPIHEEPFQEKYKVG